MTAASSLHVWDAFVGVQCEQVGAEHTALGCSGVQHYSCDCQSVREELRHPVVELHVGDCGFQLSDV